MTPIGIYLIHHVINWSHAPLSTYVWPICVISVKTFKVVLINKLFGGKKWFKIERDLRTEKRQGKSTTYSLSNRLTRRWSTSSLRTIFDYRLTCDDDRWRQTAAVCRASHIWQFEFLSTVFPDDRSIAVRLCVWSSVRWSPNRTWRVHRSASEWV